MLRLLPFLAIVTLLSPGIQTTGTPPASTWVTLADSTEWGTGGTVADLTTVIPQFRALEEASGTQPALPLDTTGWTTIPLSACTETALETAIAAATVEERIIDASACDEIPVSVKDAGLPGNPFVQWDSPPDRVVLRGKPVTGTTISYAYGGGEPDLDDGLRDALFRVGSSSSPSALATWGLDRGHGFNSQVVGTDDSMTALYEGDIIWISEPSGFAFTGGTHNTNGPTEFRFVRRVLCARWADTNHGTDCTGVSANGDVRIDAPLTMNLRSDGPYEYSDQLVGFEIKHMERNGGGTLTDQIDEYVGIENFNFEHSHGYAIRDNNPALRIQGLEYFWTKNLTFNAHGHSRLDFGGSGTHTGPGVLIGTTFNDNAFAHRCNVTVASATTDNPTQFVLNTNASCQTAGVWNEGQFGGEPGLWFPPDYPIAALQNQKVPYNVVSGPSGGTITVELLGVDGAGFPASPGGWTTLLRWFSTASVYLRAGTSGVQFANTLCDNCRIGFLGQGAMEWASLYTHFNADANEPVSRGLFDHDGFGPYLWEGNRSNALWMTQQAGSPAAGPGNGPHGVAFRNHFRADGGATSTFWGGLNAFHTNTHLANMVNEQASQRAQVGVHFFSLFGNVMAGVGSSGLIDECDNDGDLNCVTDERLGGFEVINGLRETGNLWVSYDIDSHLDPNNNTTVSPESDAGEGNEGTELSVGDRAREYPTSLIYTEVPSWWCTQSGTFPNIGAEVYDAETNNDPLLPAEIRQNGTTCTPP